MLITGPQKLSMWKTLYSEQQTYLDEWIKVMIENKIDDWKDYREYQAEINLLQIYGDTIQKLEKFIKRGYRKMNKSVISTISTVPLYDDNLRQRLIDKIPQLGDFDFTDDVWYYNHKHKDSRAKFYYVVRFHKVNEPYKSLLKYYALIKTILFSASNKNILYYSLYTFFK